MLNNPICILNFDDSLIKQEKLLLQYKPKILDLKDIAPRVRLWMDTKTKKDIEARIKDGAENRISFLGSGDFHHISQILINQIEEPVSLIVFDLHPDWDTLPPRFGCGSWLTQSLKNKNILKCILIGVSSSDISNIRLQTGNLASLKNNRVEIYPYSHRPSLVFFKSVPENISIKVKKGFLYNRIYWNELKERNLTEFFLSIVKRIPTKQVYVSIDKDCLKKEYALTNWEEGLLSLDQLLLMLKIIKDNLDIVGMDLAGDYSKISISGKFKTILSRLDHPKDIDADGFSECFITATNESTNLKILELLQSH